MHEQTGAEGKSSFACWLGSLTPAVFKTEADLARACKVPQSTVIRWRRGETRPRVEQLLTLAEVTGTDIALLVRIAGYKPPGESSGP